MARKGMINDETISLRFNQTLKDLPEDLYQSWRSLGVLDMKRLKEGMIIELDQSYLFIILEDDKLNLRVEEKNGTIKKR